MDLNIKDINILREKARQIRIDIFNMIFNAKAGHIGSSLSCTDILTVLYYSIMNTDPKNPYWEERDRYIHSKGHAVEAYYCVLANKGFFDKEELKEFSSFGSRLIGHPNNKVPGIEMNTGALGHGLPIAVGMALSAKIYKKSYKVYILMGDGEQAEGSVWEAAMAAKHYKLDNLIAIIDRNGLQMSGDTEKVMQLESLEAKWKSFGWKVMDVDGHDISELIDKFSNTPLEKSKPTILIANTVKGKGCSYMENVGHWHHKVPNQKEMELALNEFEEMKVICDEK